MISSITKGKLVDCDIVKEYAEKDGLVFEFIQARFEIDVTDTHGKECTEMYFGKIRKNGYRYILSPEKLKEVFGL